MASFLFFPGASWPSASLGFDLWSVASRMSIGWYKQLCLVIEDPMEAVAEMSFDVTRLRYWAEVFLLLVCVQAQDLLLKWPQVLGPEVHLQNDGGPHTDWTVLESWGRHFLYPLCQHQGARQALSLMIFLSWSEGIGSLWLDSSITGSVCHMYMVLFLRVLRAKQRDAVLWVLSQGEIPGRTDFRGVYLGLHGPMWKVQCSMSGLKEPLSGCLPMFCIQKCSCQPDWDHARNRGEGLALPAERVHTFPSQHRV